MSEEKKIRIWKPLPSDDFVFNKLCSLYGVSSKFKFYEICLIFYLFLQFFQINFSDGEELEDNPHIPLPIFAIIALIPQYVIIFF